MNILIKQSAGFGDIFFAQKIGQKLIEFGHTVYWPVYEEYQYVKDYLKNGVIWESPASGVEHTELRIEYASVLTKSDDIMGSKYVYANNTYNGIGTYEGWQDYLKITRNYEKEKALCDIVLKDVPDEFAVVVNHFSTQHLKLKNKVVSELPSVEIDKIKGFTIFDWCGVLEKASEIRIPDSSFPYMVEVLDTTNNLYMYKRDTEKEIITKHIWSKPWRFVE